jgi:hypothetical protein
MDATTTPAGSETATSSPTRRRALGLIGAGGVTLAAAACADSQADSGAGTGAPAPTAPAGPLSTVPAASVADAAPVQLLADDGMNYDALTVLGSSAYGLAEVGEVITMVNTINAAGPDVETYTETWLAWGDQLATRAADTGRVDPTGATLESLRAANYYESALFFVLGSSLGAQEQQLYDRFRASWDTAAPALSELVEPLAIPYEGRTMPGWFFAPDRSGKRRRTLIINNGSDGQLTWVWGYGAAAALARDWNVLLFEGPGQGSMLFVDQLPFRYDWERVITPIVDALTDRKDVDPERIALMGLSMGGELVCRAAAFEQRLAAVVAGPGVVQPWLAFPAELRSIVTDDKDATNAIWTQDVVPIVTGEQKFELMKRLEPYGAACMQAARRGDLPTDFWTPVQTIQQQDITAVAPKITSPTLVLDYDGEQFYPGQAETLMGLLTCPKDYVKLSAAEGAQLHCSPMAPQVHNEVTLSWLERTVG